MLAVGDDELGIGDNKDVLSGFAEGEAHAGGLWHTQSCVCHDAHNISELAPPGIWWRWIPHMIIFKLYSLR